MLVAHWLPSPPSSPFLQLSETKLAVTVALNVLGSDYVLLKATFQAIDLVPKYYGVLCSPMSPTAEAVGHPALCPSDDVPIESELVDKEMVPADVTHLFEEDSKDVSNVLRNITADDAPLLPDALSDLQYGCSPSSQRCSTQCSSSGLCRTWSLVGPQCFESNSNSSGYEPCNSVHSIEFDLQAVTLKEALVLEVERSAACRTSS